MTIIVVGLNHRSAPVAVRERLSMSGAALEHALAALLERGAEARCLDEVAILSTCNRTEVYASVADEASGNAMVEASLSLMHGMDAGELDGHLYRFSGDAAVEQLMRVACGLDSMILGEAQILGQVRAAFDAARNAGATGAVLSHLFAQALRTGKRARTESAISRYTTSVSHAGALLLLNQLDRKLTPNVLVLGVGEMALLAVQSFGRVEGCRLGFVNRTQERAEQLAEQCGGRTWSWLHLEEALLWADGVLCATGAPHPVIYRRDLEAVMAQRGGRELVIVDLAVPRDVEAADGEVAGAGIYSVDDLQSVIEENLALRRGAIPQVEAIIDEERRRFAEWYYGREVAPVIRDLRAWAQQVAGEELEQALRRLSTADERTRQIVATLSHRLVNRLLHEPTTRLRLQALEGNGDGGARAVRELFALDQKAAPERDTTGGSLEATVQERTA